MLSVGLCGILGFFVYDAYRFNLVYQRKEILEIFPGGFIGFLAKLSVYTAAAILSILASLDVLLGSPIAFELTPEYIGSYLRAFGIGLAGPAGISKFDADAGMDADNSPTKSQNGSIDTLDGIRQSTLRAQVKYSLRRIFLR
jgi:hypothetical protein